ncbi:hypothetical protein ACJMK2_026903 [Sinanodonta woodiana]|uniref:Uncharacterized protein n=1 Tax=Sinanodonta woodiana TaxID=1069815 RepID=A0ABD3XLI1_SINWO
MFLFFKGISYILYRQLCTGDDTLSGWLCKDCSRIPPTLIMTTSLNNMLRILPITESTHLTADEEMNTDVINSVNDSDMSIDNSSITTEMLFLLVPSRLPPDVNSHTWTASQNKEVTCVFNIDASYKDTENKEEWSIQEPKLQLILNHMR